MQLSRMIAFMKAVGAYGDRHEPLQFTIISVFVGKTRSVVYQKWVIVCFKSGEGRHFMVLITIIPQWLGNSTILVNKSLKDFHQHRVLLPYFNVHVYVVIICLTNLVTKLRMRWVTN